MTSAPSQTVHPRRVVANFVLGVVLISLLVLSPFLIRILLYQPFSIPSGSQKPTLLVGDSIFVSKFSYGYTHYSLPYSPPLFSGRILASEPQRGDVVVYRLPRNDSVDYVSRVIGLPGERIQMINGLLHINGRPVMRERIEDFVDTEDGRNTQIKRWRETLPDGVAHPTLDQMDNGFYDNTNVYEVPPGHYFMMSDNRDNAVDSRALTQVGYVPFENIVGRAEIIFWSVDRSSGGIRAERLGT